MSLLDLQEVMFSFSYDDVQWALALDTVHTYKLQLESWMGNGHDREPKPMDSTGWKHMVQESFGDGSRCHRTPRGMEINVS